MQHAFSSLQPHLVATRLLESLLVCEPEAVAEAEARLVADTSAHVLFRGPTGLGKSHCAETLVRRLEQRHGWRAVRLAPACHFLQGFDEFAAAIADRERQVERPWDEPAPGAEVSLQMLRERERDIGRPLVILLEDLPGVVERSLRGGDTKRFLTMMRQLRLSVVATAQTVRLGRAARPLLAQFHEIPLGTLDAHRSEELLRRCAAWAGDAPDGPVAVCARAFLPILGGNPRLITTLYGIAHRRLTYESARPSAGREDDESDLPLTPLLERMEPRFRAQLDALSAQQGLVLARLALAPGPMPAARLGRQCDLPTSHTTAILDVLLQRQLVVRVPGPGKRNVYALADNLLRLFIREHAGGHSQDLRVLLRFFARARSVAPRKRALYALRAHFAHTLRVRLAPRLGAVRWATQLLASALRARDLDPGNRVLAAFLAQPPTAHDVVQLRASTRTDVSESPQASAPERAVSHVALAAHLMHEERWLEAAEELARALELGPNWRDLALTASLVRLAGGSLVQVPIHDDLGALGAVVAAAVGFFAGAPDAEQRLRATIAECGPEYASAWLAIAAVVPLTEAMHERAMAFFQCVSAAGVASADFFGVACVYAFESGLWSSALGYVAQRDARQPLDPESWPVWVWLAAMSGDLDAFVAIALRCQSSGIAPPWLMAASAVAARASSDPERVAEEMAQLAGPSPAEQSGVPGAVERREELFAALLLIRDEVSADWLARVSAGLADRLGYEPRPFQAFRAFVDSGQDERTLRTLHPEMRAAVEILWAH